MNNSAKPPLTKLCENCRFFGVCREAKSLFVTDQELADPEFIRDGRAACAAQGQSAEHWIEHVNDLYRDYRGRIFDHEGHQIILSMDVFEMPFIREWFRDFACTSCPPAIIPRVRAPARPRVRVLLTVMRASFPGEAKHWGIRQPANDNGPSKDTRQKS